MHINRINDEYKVVLTGGKPDLATVVQIARDLWRCPRCGVLFSFQTQHCVHCARGNTTYQLRRKTDDK